jgi:hypothetical protein
VPVDQLQAVIVVFATASPFESAAIVRKYRSLRQGLCRARFQRGELAMKVCGDDGVLQ